MNFGLFSNGFRPHTTAARTYEEDLFEILLADELGFRDAWISEHHGEPGYVDRVDVLPVPELLMCKAAALTKRIRFGAAVKVIHLLHPVDVAMQAAVADHVIGDGRFMFGFGTGFATPQFSEQRGLSYEDRHERMMESLDVILKCWASKEPFDLDGRFWKGKGITVWPSPLQEPHMPLAVATATESTVELAAERGYTVLHAHIDAPWTIRSKGETYVQAASAAGHERPLENFSVARYVYVADSVEEAIEDLAPAATDEMQFQRERGFIKMLVATYDLPHSVDETRFTDLVEAGLYYVGDPDTVAERLMQFYDESGGFGTLLLVAGKDWATREKRARSMRRFMEEVAPRLAHLRPDTPRGVAGAPRRLAKPT